MIPLPPLSGTLPLLALLLAGCGEREESELPGPLQPLASALQDAVTSYQDKKRSEGFMVKRYLRPDNEERRSSREVAMVLEALGELDGLAVADVGAGAGFFTYMLAEMVGPEGKGGSYTVTGCRAELHPAGS
jgi:hypothetical protein